MCICVGYSVHVEVRGQLAVLGSLLLPLWDLGIKVRDLRLGGQDLYPQSHLVNSSLLSLHHC